MEIADPPRRYLEITAMNGHMTGYPVKDYHPVIFHGLDNLTSWPSLQAMGVPAS